jgi:hypothetical protein
MLARCHACSVIVIRYFGVTFGLPPGVPGAGTTVPDCGAVAGGFTVIPLSTSGGRITPPPALAVPALPVVPCAGAITSGGGYFPGGDGGAGWGGACAHATPETNKPAKPSNASE